MASPEVIQLAAILSAIPGDNPAGKSLREDVALLPLYYQVKDARSAARAAERNVVWQDEKEVSSVERADWKPVFDLSVKILQEASKDLEVAAWLTESLVRVHGYAGLRAGFQILSGLVERYWDGLYPLPDEEGLATRLAPLVGLNGEDSEGVLIQPISNVPVTAAGSYRAMTIADYRQALQLEKADQGGRREQRLAQGGVTLAMFTTGVAETPPERLRDLWEDLHECLAESNRLSQLLDEKCGRDASGYPLAPASSNIRHALEDCLELARQFARDVVGVPAAEEVTAEMEDASGLVPVGHRAGGEISGRVQTREDAFRALLQVADFFRRTEPHSPVSYALEQAVRWGRLSLPELLGELIPDEVSREHLFKLVGIPRGPEKE